MFVCSDWYISFPGGRLISLNKTSLEGVTFSDAAAILQSSPDEVELIVSQPKCKVHPFGWLWQLLQWRSVADQTRLFSQRLWETARRPSARARWAWRWNEVSARRPHWAAPSTVLPWRSWRRPSTCPAWPPPKWANDSTSQWCGYTTPRFGEWWFLFWRGSHSQWWTLYGASLPVFRTPAPGRRPS